MAGKRMSREEHRYRMILRRQRQRAREAPPQRPKRTRLEREMLAELIRKKGWAV